MVETALEIQQHLYKAHRLACTAIITAFCEDLDAQVFKICEHRGAKEVQGGGLARKEGKQASQESLGKPTGVGSGLRIKD